MLGEGFHPIRPALFKVLYVAFSSTKQMNKPFLYYSCHVVLVQRWLVSFLQTPAQTRSQREHSTDDYHRLVYGITPDGPLNLRGTRWWNGLKLKKAARSKNQARRSSFGLW